VFFCVNLGKYWCFNFSFRMLC